MIRVVEYFDGIADLIGGRQRAKGRFEAMRFAVRVGKPDHRAVDSRASGLEDSFFEADYAARSVHALLVLLSLGEYGVDSANQTSDRDHSGDETTYDEHL